MSGSLKTLEAGGGGFQLPAGLPASPQTQVWQLPQWLLYSQSTWAWGGCSGMSQSLEPWSLAEFKAEPYGSAQCSECLRRPFGDFPTLRSVLPVSPSPPGSGRSAGRVPGTAFPRIFLSPPISTSPAFFSHVFSCRITSLFISHNDKAPFSLLSSFSPASFCFGCQQGLTFLHPG